MNISKRSWHYRYMDWLGFDVRGTHSLCIYFWKLVFALTVPPIFMGIATLVALPLHYMGLIDLKLLPQLISGALIVCGVAGWVAVTLFLAWYLSEYAHKRSIARRNSTTAPQQPNVFIAYIKAKKQKVCPIIDYTE